MSWKLIDFFYALLREDAHKNLFSGWTTKRGGGRMRIKPPEPLKNTFFYQLKNLPKPHEPLGSRGPTTKNTFFMCLPEEFYRFHMLGTFTFQALSQSKKKFWGFEGGFGSWHTYCDEWPISQCNLAIPKNCFGIMKERALWKVNKMNCILRP